MIKQRREFGEVGLKTSFEDSMKSAANWMPMMKFDCKDLGEEPILCELSRDCCTGSGLCNLREAKVSKLSSPRRSDSMWTTKKNAQDTGQVR